MIPLSDVGFRLQQTPICCEDVTSISNFFPWVFALYLSTRGLRKSCAQGIQYSDLVISAVLYLMNRASSIQGSSCIQESAAAFGSQEKPQSTVSLD